MISSYVLVVCVLFMMMHNGVVVRSKKRQVNENIDQWYVATDAVIPDVKKQQKKYFKNIFSFFVWWKKDIPLKNQYRLGNILEQPEEPLYQEIFGDRFQNMPAPSYPPRLPPRNHESSNVQNNLYEVPTTRESSRISSWL